MRNAGRATIGKNAHTFTGLECLVRFLNNCDQRAAVEFDRDLDTVAPRRALFDRLAGNTPCNRAEHGRDAAAAQILDVGCGTGEAPVRLVDKFPDATVIGVDAYPSRVEFAQRRHGGHSNRLAFQHADPYQLPFADGGYD